MRAFAGIAMVVGFVGGARAQVPPPTTMPPPPMSTPLSAPMPMSPSTPLERPLPQAMVGEMNRGYESLMGAAPTSAFTGPVRNEAPFWFRADGLLSFTTRSTLPPLLTTSTNGTARAAAGRLDFPGTTILIGGGRPDNSAFRGGAAFNLGIQPLTEYSASIELGFQFLQKRDTNSTFASDSTQILGRPFTDAATGGQQAVLVAFPGLSAGNFTAISSSGNLYISNATIADRIVDTGRFRLNFLAGYRRFDQEDSLTMVSNLFATDPNVVPGTTIRTFDRFHTTGIFNGADLGVRGEIMDGPMTIEILGRMAFGQLHRTIDIEGNQIINVPGTTPTTNQGGFFALASNLGHYESNRSAVMPEFGTALRYQFAPHLEARFGYSATLLSGVFRASDQIDQTINQNNFPPVVPPGGGRPGIPFKSSEIWVHSLTLGLTLGF